jgi:flagellar hook-length control protein FliK
VECKLLFVTTLTKKGVVVILQNTKNQTAGFSLMQLLGGTKDLDNSATFAQLLSQLGLNSKELGDENISFLEQLGEKSVTKEAFLEGPGLDLKHLKSDDLDALLASLNTNKSKKSEIKDEILQLLQGDDAFVEDDLHVMNPKLIETVPQLDLKAIIADAKTYLKDKIGELAKAKGIEIDLQTLPKTLKSLSLVAEKIGVQLDKVTLETIQAKGAVVDTTQKQTSILQTQSRPQEHTTQEFVRARTEQTTNTSTTVVKETQELVKSEPLKALLTVPVVDKKAVHKKEPRVELASDTQVIPKSAPKPELHTAPSPTTPQLADSDELVQVAPKLESTSNPSDASADSDTDSMTKLSSLLYGDAHSTDKTVEVDGDGETVSITKSDSKGLELELKVKEAKQMVVKLSADIKEAVENYKPPFTRIKLQLNPVKLGEVDVTMIQRGNNVHINISSNNSAVAILAQNSVELKTQLANNGLSNATMQFNTSGGEQQRQSQHQQNMMDQYEKYAKFDNEENFETLTAMELIIPRYV